MTVNMPIQGTAADILKQAMIDVHAALASATPAPARAPDDSHGARRAAVRGPETEPAKSPIRVRDGMERASALSVPLTVDVGIGKNWKEAKD